MVPGNNGMFLPTMVVDGEVVGTWKRAAGDPGDRDRLSPFRPLPAAAGEDSPTPSGHTERSWARRPGSGEDRLVTRRCHTRRPRASSTRPRIERGWKERARGVRSTGGERSSPLVMVASAAACGGSGTKPEPECQHGDQLRRVRDGNLLGVGDAVPRRRQPRDGGLDRRCSPAPGGGRGPRRCDGRGAPGPDQHRARGRTREDRLCRRLAARCPVDGRDGPLLESQRRPGSLPTSTSPRGSPAAPDPQAAFEAAGGVESWRAMFEAYADVTPYRPASVAQCPGAPVSP